MVGRLPKAVSEATTPGASRAMALASRATGMFRESSSTLTVRPVVVASNSDTARRTPTTTISSTEVAPLAPRVKVRLVVPELPTITTSVRVL